MNVFVVICFLFYITLAIGKEEETCETGYKKEEKFILFSVNFGEGFNLRRDVYLRMANLVRKLNEIDNWVLVLPPWGNFYHWTSTQQSVYYPWSSFFDIQSLKKWIPVIEFSDFLEVEGGKVNTAYVLQHYAEGWGGKWEEKYEERPCIEENPFVHHTDKYWHGQLWGNTLIAEKFTCLSIQGQASTLLPLLTGTDIRSILIGRAETILHDDYGGKWFWAARRSMRFASHLQKAANRFRSVFLDSDDIKDKTEVTEDWRDTKPKRGTAEGGPYISVHLRRRDFVYARGNEVPSLKKAAKQIAKLLKEHDLNKVFVATDASIQEIQELERELNGYHVLHYSPSPEFVHQWGDGGVAIVDQIICSHARYFIGTYESTFSFRIQEEREILGFPVETTFNRLCGKNAKCEQPAKWKIVY